VHVERNTAVCVAVPGEHFDFEHFEPEERHRLYLLSEDQEQFPVLILLLISQFS
jgi:hypothetical protein